MKDRIIMQINIENEEDFKHIIKPLTKVETLALIEYLDMIRYELREDIELESIDL